MKNYLSNINLYPIYKNWKNNIWILGGDLKYLSDIMCKINVEDTLVIIGKVENLSLISVLNVRYKILIFDGESEEVVNFSRVITNKKYIGLDKCPICGNVVTYSDNGKISYFNESETRGWCRHCIQSVSPIKNYVGEDYDNHLFDEVYFGSMFINNNLIITSSINNFTESNINTFNFIYYDNNDNLLHSIINKKSSFYEYICISNK